MSHPDPQPPLSSRLQEIYLASDRPNSTRLSREGGEVNNVVELAGLGELRVEAEASTSARPVPGFVPRRGDGNVLGFYPLGKSMAGPPSREGVRIDFRFDYAAFDFAAVPFKIPYPVPFRALRETGLADEVKGWVDVTYMNDDASFRLTRGNKGTLFILQR